MCSTGYIDKLPAEILELTEHSYKEPKINEKTQEWDMPKTGKISRNPKINLSYQVKFKIGCSWIYFILE